MEAVKEQLENVLTFMEKKSGTIDKPRSLTLDEEFQVYQMISEIARKL